MPLLPGQGGAEEPQVIRGARRTDPAGRTRGSTKLARPGGGVAVVLAKMLRLQEEDVFRTIVGYL